MLILYCCCSSSLLTTVSKLSFTRSSPLHGSMQCFCIPHFIHVFKLNFVHYLHTFRMKKFFASLLLNANLHKYILLISYKFDYSQEMSLISFQTTRFPLTCKICESLLAKDINSVTLFHCKLLSCMTPS